MPRPKFLCKKIYSSVASSNSNFVIWFHLEISLKFLFLSLVVWLVFRAAFLIFTGIFLFVFCHKCHCEWHFESVPVFKFLHNIFPIKSVPLGRDRKLFYFNAFLFPPLLPYTWENHVSQCAEVEGANSTMPLSDWCSLEELSSECGSSGGWEGWGGWRSMTFS